MTEQHRRDPGLIATGVVLLGLGCLAIFTIGLPVLLAGVLMLTAGLTNAHRTLPRVFWPAVAAITAFFCGYLLVAPLSCTTEAVAVDIEEAVSGLATGATACANLLGITYAGGPGYNPPLWPAAIAGVGAGAAVGLSARGLITRGRAGR